MSYDEFYLAKWEEQKIIVDMQTGRFGDWDGDKQAFERLRRIGPNFELSSRQKRYIERHVIVNNRLMRTDRNVYGLDQYPFVPFLAIHEPEVDDWSLKFQSLVRCMRDPQSESNKRRSQMVDLLDSQLNSGWVATEGSVINSSNLFQTAQGKVIWKKRGSQPGDLERIQPAQIPPSSFQMQQQFDADIKDVAGVNDASFGQMESGNESSVLVMLRQGAALTNVQGVFDKLRVSQKHLSNIC